MSDPYDELAMQVAYKIHDSRWPYSGCAGKCNLSIDMAHDIAAALRDAVKAEREECALLFEESLHTRWTADEAAAAIRARGEQ